MTPHLFDPVVLRDYDVRGTVGRNLGEADARAVGRSFATRVRRTGGRRIAVGRDGRLSSPMLEAALVAGLTAGGCDVVRIGLAASPMLYFAEATLGVDAAVQVTGSHNPAGDNGFKLVLGHRSFWGDDVADLARLAAAADWTEGAGTVAEADVHDAYCTRLLAGHALPALRVGWDAGNGAAGPLLERLVARLPGEHRLLHTAVDGTFPHHHPDPTIEANLADLQALVRAEALDLGIAFDGDADRIGVVDGTGAVLWADQLLAILAEPVLAAFPGAPIVADVKSSAALFDRISALGGRAVMARTGHSPMKARIAETGAPLGGELSGHIFYAHDYFGFDDAFYAALKLLAALADGRSLAERRRAMPALVAIPERRVPIAESRKAGAVAAAVAWAKARGGAVDETDGARVTTPDGWWLLRASNTGAELTVRAEGRDHAALDRLLAEVDAALAAAGARD